MHMQENFRFFRSARMVKSVSYVIPRKFRVCTVYCAVAVSISWNFKVLAFIFLL